MKFKIRYADQIVGFFSLVAIIGLIVLVFLIGSGQHWFTRKLEFYTMFDSGSGISVGMNLQYKGFAIGKIKSIALEGNNVRVNYYILGEYENYVHKNSLVQLNISPIGLGSEFIFHPGTDTELMQEGEIFRIDSSEGQKILAEKLNLAEKQSDSIGALMNKASSLLDNINNLLSQINDGLSGNEETIVGAMLVDIDKILKDIQELTSSIKTIDNLLPRLLGNTMASDLQNILTNVENLSKSLTTTVQSADKLVSGTDSEISGLMADIDALLLQVEDLMTGLKNNPLIKNGIPDRSQSSPGTFHVREKDF